MDQNNRRLTTTAFALCILMVGAAQGQESEAPVKTVTAPLFASDEILTVTIEGPLDKVFKERDDDKEEFDAELRYVGADGAEVAVPIELRTRGHFRLQRRTCPFPPLRVDVDSADVVGTVFTGLDKIKVVTHCHNKREEYEQNTLLEFLLYRAYNLFTDASFRARLAHITYIDTEAKQDTVTRYAFFIEPVEVLAARNGYEVLEVPLVPPSQMQQGALTLYEMYQYMIGNTDWDPFKPKQGEPFCCHNGELIGSMMDIVVIPVPYDFDWSGVVNARYAKPAEVLEIRSVRERRFWGICRSEEAWRELMPEFLAKREAVYDLFRLQPDLEPKRIEQTLDFLDEFYELIGDADEAVDVFERECRG